MKDQIAVVTGGALRTVATLSLGFFWLAVAVILYLELFSRYRRYFRKRMV